MTPAPLAEIAQLLEHGGLTDFRSRHGGLNDCHPIAACLLAGLQAAGSKRAWSWLVGRQQHRGDHSWLEADGWAIDASHGADSPMLVMLAGMYRAEIGAHDVQTVAQLSGGILKIASAIAPRAGMLVRR